jgi:adenylylsulfate reductase subunit B
MWTIRFRNGNMKRFRFPTRTTAENSINPYAGKPEANMDEISDPQVLFTRSAHACDMSQFIDC